ncbi:MAG: peptidylprolyl isomerase [Deltaproteobacteria bacterium]|nr:peptidylprolyl isomerase [Deltaproteobacteria bacterium]TLN03614.1 MAG: peptidylprolyl isomerase [bacterium]
MKKTIVLLVALLLVLPLVASAELVSAIAALVNDEPITTYDLAKEEEAMKSGMGDTSALTTAAARAQLRQTALDALVNKKLIEQKVKELDIRVSDEEVRQAIEDVKKTNSISEENLVAALAARGITFDEYKVQLKDQLERLRLISLEVRSKIQVSEKEIQDYFSAHAGNYQVDEAFHARQIFLAVPAAATEDQQKRILEKAEKVLREAKSGADFSELAKKYSDDPSGKEGGDLGFLNKGELLPEFEKVLISMRVGEVSGLVRTSAGIHIIKLVDYREGKTQSLDSAKREVEDLLYKQKSEERFSQWLDGLRKNAAIEIIERK